MRVAGFSTSMRARGAVRAVGLEALNTCVWVKDNGGMGSLYRSRHEFVGVFKVPGAPHRNNVELGKHGRNRTNVWEYPGAASFSKASDEGWLNELHPTVKPVSLIADALLDCSVRGDLLLDPFLGSSSSLIAAERVGRKCRGLEIDPLYVDVAIRDWLRFYDPAERRGRPSRVVQSWDTANKTPELNDYSVCATWHVYGNDRYLVDVFRQRLNYQDLRRAVVAQARMFKANVVLIEDKASGTQLIQDMKNDHLYGVTEYKPPAGADKIMRLHACTDRFENGHVFLPRAAPWLDDYVAELIGFPGTRYDDQVDSTTQVCGSRTTLRPT